MARNLATNNASTTLASAITAGATTITVTAGGGAGFPHPVSPQYFRFTLVKNGNPSVFEIGKCIAYPSADTFTVVRGQEGTTAQSWSAGDYFNLLFTAGDFGDSTQFDDLQAQSTNYALDVGTANNYSVTLSPALVAHVTGAPIRFKAANSNTAASTFNDGAGSAALVLPGGAALSAGTITATGIYTAVWDGARFQLTNAPTSATGLEQTIINMIYPVGAYVMWETDTTNPGAVFTWQTWTEVSGVVLVGRNTADPNFANTGQTGGEETHQLVPQEVPPLNYQDLYYPESPQSIAVHGATQYTTIGSLNNSMGSGSSDNDNTLCLYANRTTLSGTLLNGTGVATPHNNLQPYRVVRMWRRTA